ncbi:MAG: hypothetical protein ACREV3_03045 [Gammaproteobacteria bacterium]
MKHINTAVAIRLEFVGFDDPRPVAYPATERAARSLPPRRLAGAARGPADAHRAHLLGDHRGATAGRACDIIWEAAFA